MSEKFKLANYWAASCGGCEIAVLDIEEKILDVDANFDIVFWPVAVDFKVKDVKALPDKSITVCLFNGSIRNDENEEMAKLLRQKSVVMVAFGSCAQEGCIPGLANLFSKESILDYVYKQSPSVDNPNGIIPQPSTKLNGYHLDLPVLYDRLRPLHDVVDVDYTIPGCPPQSDQVATVIMALIDILKNGKPLPPRGAILGAGDKTCCEECARVREDKKIKKFIRPHEIIPDPEKCLLDQGILCLGPATRSGCGAKCPAVHIPCRGCYGPPPNSHDPGARMIAALSSVLDATTLEDAEKILDTLADPIGTFYRFGLADSTIPAALTTTEKISSKGERHA